MTTFMYLEDLVDSIDDEGSWQTRLLANLRGQEAPLGLRRSKEIAVSNIVSVGQHTEVEGESGGDALLNGVRGFDLSGPQLLSGELGHLDWISHGTLA